MSAPPPAEGHVTLDIDQRKDTPGAAEGKLSRDQSHSQSDSAVSPELLKNIAERAAANREKYRRSGSLQEKASNQRDQTVDPQPFQTVLSRNKVLGEVLGDVSEDINGLICASTSFYFL
jgi:hypothetical protein